MKVAAKRELLRTLRLDAPSANPGVDSRPAGLRLGFVVPLCAASAWLVVQMGLAEVTFEESLQTPAIELSQQEVSTPSAASSVTDETARILLQANGYVTANQSATVSARTTAVVNAVYVEEGDLVGEGELLARLDDRLKRAEYELAVSEHEGSRIRMAEVETELAAANRRMHRVKQLAESNLASVAELDAVTTRVEVLNAQLASLAADVRIAGEQVQLQRVALQDFEIRAPFDGVVTERTAQPGEIVSPVSAGGGFTRTGIATLVNMGSLEIEVDVNESHIGKVTDDQKVEVVLTAYPEVTYAGKVLAIIPRGDRSKGTVKVRVELIDTDDRILPEMGARVDFLGT